MIRVGVRKTQNPPALPITPRTPKIARALTTFGVRKTAPPTKKAIKESSSIALCHLFLQGLLLVSIGLNLLAVEILNNEQTENTTSTPETPAEESSEAEAGENSAEETPAA